MDSEVDHRVRIFLMAGGCSPAIDAGCAHARLAAGGKPRSRDEIVQQCGVGLVRVRRDGKRLAFAAPPLRRSGDVDVPTLAAVTRSLGVERKAIRAAQWVDNGPGWVAVMLGSRDELLALKPDFARLTRRTSASSRRLPPGNEALFEMRAFIGGSARTRTPSRAACKRASRSG